MKLCCLLNYEKLSEEACIHLSQNAKFPSKSALQALISQQVKLRSLLHATNNPKSFGDSPFSVTEVDNEGRNGHDSNEQCVLYAGKLDLSADNEKLREHLHGMQWRVMELEKMCKKMQPKWQKFTKSSVIKPESCKIFPQTLCS